MKLAFEAFPDWHEAIEDIIAEGDKVWVRVEATATHTGEYLGLAPTGKKTTIKFVDIFRVVNGKLIEAWIVADNLDFYKELGVIEYKGFPDEVR